MTDRWIFEGSKDETVIAHVTTQEFDSVLRLVRTDGDEETLLIEIDDDGSDGWLSFRLPADGKYKICVTGFENKGGGNYSLSMRQFRATATAPGQTQSGTFDRNGKAFYYFGAATGQHFTVDIRGNSSTDWAVLDTQGKPVVNWNRLVGTKNEGEYLIELSGRSGRRFEVTLRAAEPASWPENAEVSGKLASRQATVIDLLGKTGEFRVLELSCQGDLASRLVHVPDESADDGQSIGDDNQRPELTYLPIGSKGTIHRFAVIWGRNDRFQLHLCSEFGAEFQATYRDPAIPTECNSTGPHSMKVGNTSYFRVPIQKGETITARVTTSEFDPEMRLFNDAGKQRAGDDDGGGQLNSQLQYSARRDEQVLLAVSSVGNGGGGAFELNIKTEEARRIAVGESQTRNPPPGATEQWLFSAKKDQSVFSHVNGGDHQPRVVLRNSRGVDMSVATAAGNANDALLMHTFTDAGDYSIWVSVGKGSRYTLNAIEVNK